MQTPATAQSGNPGAPRVCVLWLPPDEPAPEALLRACSRKGMRTRVVRSAYHVLAAACGSDARNASGSLIVLASPPSLPQHARTLALLRRYAPRVILAAYDGKPLSLRPLSPEEFAPDGTDSPPAPRFPDAPPVLRLHEANGAEGEDEREESAPGGRALLSDEELSMLLGDAWATEEADDKRPD